MSASGVKITGTSFHGVTRLADRMRRLGEARILVGIPKGKENDDGESLALVGARVEFGVGHAPLKLWIPERPFLRGGLRAATPKLKGQAAGLARAVANERMSPDAAAETLGLSAAGEVKQYMTGPNFFPNAPSTIAKKGSSQPTIDEGQLRQAITHRVEHGGGGK